MPKTQQLEVHRPAVHDVFTDRQGERGRLRSLFEGLCANPIRRDKPILAFYGVGGVGKTSVRNEAVRESRERPAEGAVRLSFADCNVDADEFTPDQPIMSFFGNALRPALRKAGFTLPLFSTFYCSWFGQSSSDTELSRDKVLADVIGVGEDSVDLVGRLIAGLDALGSTFKGTALALKAATAFREWRRKNALAETLPQLDLNSLELSQFHQYAGDVLALDLLTELRDKPDKALCLTLDGFERIQSRELRADLQHGLQDLFARLLLADPPV